jgi:hypothetical protein
MFGCMSTGSSHLDLALTGAAAAFCAWNFIRGILTRRTWARDVPDIDRRRAPISYGIVICLWGIAALACFVAFVQELRWFNHG